MKIPVLRLGDTSKLSVVRVHTKDGSATSGDDYNPLSEGNTLAECSLCIPLIVSY